MAKNIRCSTQTLPGHESFLFRSAVLDLDLDGSITSERPSKSDGAVDGRRTTDTDARGVPAVSSLHALDEEHEETDISSKASPPSTGNAVAQQLKRLHQSVQCNDLHMQLQHRSEVWSTRGEEDRSAHSATSPSPGVSTTLTAHQRNAGRHTIIAFVNSASGGRMGNEIYESLQSHLGASHVHDLNSCHPGNMPEDILLKYAYDPMVRILACGGDGTCGWIFSSLDKVWSTVLGGTSPKDRVHLSKYKEHLPLAIMPLGTGNDLSQQFDWGGKFKSYMKDKSMITAVQTSASSSLDRWRCIVMPVEILAKDEKESIPKTLREITHDASDAQEQNHSIRKSAEFLESLLEDDDSSKQRISFSQRKHQKKPIAMPAPSAQFFDGVFCNYFSLGVDAKVTYLFHRERELHPERFSSPLKNKLIYLEEVPYAIKSPKLGNIISVMVNNEKGELVKLKVPKRCRVVILQNIQSYSGGFQLSSKGVSSDGLIEVIFVSDFLTGVTKVLAPFLSLQVAAQTDNVCIRTRSPIHCQVDGEPWLQGEGVIQVKFHSRNSILTKVNGGTNCGCMGGTEETVVK